MKISNRRTVIFLFSIFTYFSNILWLVADISPQFIRKLFLWVFVKRIGRECLVDYGCFFRYPWKVIIGNKVAINRGCEFYPSMQSSDGLIKLEDHVVLGPGVVIFAAGHDYSQLDLPDISKPVVIRKFAWVGGNTTILPGVEIGEGAVIGAGSVVTKNIPAYSVAAGNPAKVLKNRVIKEWQ